MITVNKKKIEGIVLKTNDYKENNSINVFIGCYKIFYFF